MHFQLTIFSTDYGCIGLQFIPLVVQSPPSYLSVLFNYLIFWFLNFTKFMVSCFIVWSNCNSSLILELPFFLVGMFLNSISFSFLCYNNRNQVVVPFLLIMLMARWLSRYSKCSNDMSYLLTLFPSYLKSIFCALQAQVCSHFSMGWGIAWGKEEPG